MVDETSGKGSFATGVLKVIRGGVSLCIHPLIPFLIPIPETKNVGFSFPENAKNAFSEGESDIWPIDLSR
jgi:hypothetical protein